MPRRLQMPEFSMPDAAEMLARNVYFHRRKHELPELQAGNLQLGGGSDRLLLLLCWLA
ncbi:hypothetical protein HGRIS_001610 [Hohenbuehelia grisea]|uniref:Uncharacterized protein n=1 Tax=Hohenbuehelia grisea TaxID=104357 RepID=A0ABR3JI52_9AGAR